jgi:hypothetical protein
MIMTLRKVLIKLVMTCLPEFAADGYEFKLQKIILCFAGNIDRCTSVFDLKLESRIL